MVAQKKNKTQLQP